MHCRVTKSGCYNMVHIKIHKNGLIEFDMCDRASYIQVRKMYQLDANNFTMIFFS